MSEQNISKYIGRRIKKYRELKGLTQKELGALIGMEHNTVSSYETGKNRPNQDVLHSIATALDISINLLFPPTTGDLPLIIDGEKKQTSVYNPMALTMIPIVGRISCGNGILAYEDIEGYEPVPDEWLNGGEHFCLRAKGDSMIGARIHEGDLLLIRRQPEVESGEIAAVLIDGDAVLKRVFLQNEQLILQSENPSYPPIISPGKELQIIGKLKKIIINL